MKLKILSFTCLLILVFACEKERALDKYYNQPGNFSGSIYEALDSTGRYTNLLWGADSTELANQMKNTLVTIIAPNDEAFNEYLNKHGFASISDLPKDTLENIIGNHVITWPHSSNSIILEPYWYKRLTNMPQRIITKYDHVTGADVEIVQAQKYLQFYSPEMLQAYEAYVDDYKILTGVDLSPATNFNINDVPVDSIVPYGNGWVYYVDKVIEPIQNMDDWLADNPDYSTFNRMFNRFATYGIDGAVNNRVDVKRSNLYQNVRHYRIDMELMYEPVGFKTFGDYDPPVAGSGFTVFAPENSAVDEFIDTYYNNYPGFKDSLMIIDRTSLANLHLGKIVRALLKPYMFVDLSIFPSKILSADGILSPDGTNLRFSEQDITEYSMLSNGYGYGINRYEVPRSLKSILHPSFSTPTYKYFVAAVEAADIANYMNTIDAVFTLMLPTDEAFIKNNIILVDEYTWVSDYGGSFDEWGLHETRFVDLDTLNPNAPENIEIQDLFNLVFVHMFEADIELSSLKQYEKNAPGIFVGLTEDSVWSGGNIFVEENGYRTEAPEITEVIPASTTDNGRVFVIDDLIQSPRHSIADIISINPNFATFRELCAKAGLLVDGKLDIYGNAPAAFLPTNAALDQAILDGTVPSDELSLQYFLKYFFIDRSIFTSETIDETIATLSQDLELSTEFKIIYKYAEVKGTYENLTVKGLNNTSFLPVIEGPNSNIICTDGIIHQIDGVLY